MDIHKNARLTPVGRAALVRRVVDHGHSFRRVARDFEISPKTVSKWVRRFHADGHKGLLDRSSRPQHSPRATPPEIVAQIQTLRRQRWTGEHIAHFVQVSPATVSRVLRRCGLNRLKNLEPAEPVRRYQRAHPGDLIHLDIKKLGRFRRPGHRATGNRTQDSQGAGWEFVHVCIDDNSRVGYSLIYPDERKHSAVAFLLACVRYYASLGITVKRVMTDNGSCYRSGLFARACRRLGLKHLFTRPYRPQTNGKAERFIQTALREWAYAVAYPNSHARARELPHWLHRYNWHRPHGSLRRKTPISVLGLTEDNLLRLHN